MDESLVCFRFVKDEPQCRPVPIKATSISASPLTFHNSVCWLFFLMTLIFANIFNQIRKFLYILTSCTSLCWHRRWLRKKCDTIFLIPNTFFLLKNFLSSFLLSCWVPSVFFVKVEKILSLTLLNLLRLWRPHKPLWLFLLVSSERLRSHVITLLHASNQLENSNESIWCSPKSLISLNPWTSIMRWTKADAYDSK